MALATLGEKAQLLQLVLKDVRVTKELLTPNTTISPASPFLVQV
jgi:hypothetical protein